MAFSAAISLVLITLTLLVINASAKSLHRHHHHHHHHKHYQPSSSASRLIPRMSSAERRQFDLDEEMWQEADMPVRQVPKRQAYSTDELERYEDCAACRYTVKPVETSENYHVPQGLVEVICQPDGKSQPCSEREGLWECVQTQKEVRFEGKNGKSAVSRFIMTGCVCALVDFPIAQSFSSIVPRGLGE
uniref:Uncharacterized protein n=1 Tax=Bracon brevicornis TaxID=1563983 RepID=A0A6V7L204_9HYME